ncbi:MAG: hypothetical protein Q8Q11_02380 [bacterium]|nr:hypothetical protein [bacterium]MDZ4248139.1 hypothetical protein [Patescibacteria group bacterium]
MAVNPVLNQSPNRIRNAFLMGIGFGVVAALILGALIRGNAASADDLKGVEERLTAIEEKLATPTPAPKPSAAAESLTLSAVNESSEKYIGKTVELSGKVSSEHQGVGFILVDADGSYLWVHTNANIPESTATVKGKVVKLTDQLAEWKNETGWPANDTTLTSRLREEVIFVEAEDVS